ncbi:MAG: DUF4338 domain-containing protein [Candidatus Woesebacteria bacterium]|nr:DUF4338 domain-containing protein [Candidatus Woesebacteria bacterium]
MGKVFLNKPCDVCGKVGKIIESWGKKYCRECWDKKPKKLGKGHSGMVGMDKLTIQGEMFQKSGLNLEKTKKGNKIFATLYLTHYPESKGIVGRQCNYFVKQDGEIIGIIGGNSPPLNYKKFNEFFGKDYNENNWLNNNVFRLIKTERNLGTKVLKMFRYRVKEDYEKQYKHKLIGLITFVEPPRTGAMYKADNWTFLGETQGMKCSRRGDHGKWINKEWGKGTKKLVFAKKLKGE